MVNATRGLEDSGRVCVCLRGGSCGWGLTLVAVIAFAGAQDAGPALYMCRTPT